MDFILGWGDVAVEVKGTSRLDDRELRGLRAFGEDNKPKKSILVKPWRVFFERLWAGDIIR